MINETLQSVERAEAFLKAGNVQLARKHIDDALSNYPRMPVVYAAHMGVLAAEGRRHVALSETRGQLADYPTSRTAAIYLVRLLADLGQKGDAKAAAQDLERQHVGDPDFQQTLRGYLLESLKEGAALKAHCDHIRDAGFPYHDLVDRWELSAARYADRPRTLTTLHRKRFAEGRLDATSLIEYAEAALSSGRLLTAFRNAGSAAALDPTLRPACRIIRFAAVFYALPLGWPAWLYTFATSLRAQYLNGFAGWFADWIISFFLGAAVYTILFVTGLHSLFAPEGASPVDIFKRVGIAFAPVALVFFGTPFALEWAKNRRFGSRKLKLSQDY